MFKHRASCFNMFQEQSTLLRFPPVQCFLVISLGIYFEQLDLSARAARKAESRRIVPEPIDPKASYQPGGRKKAKRTSAHNKKTDCNDCKNLRVNLRFTLKTKTLIVQDYICSMPYGRFPGFCQCYVESTYHGQYCEVWKM